MKTFYYRHRPHIQPPGATLFVTFRLYGSLPRHVIEEIKDEYDKLNKWMTECILAGQGKKEYETYYNRQKQLIAKYDEYLHTTSTGPHYLKIEKIAKLLCESMRFWDGKRYDLLSYTVMSNHVHIVFTPLEKELGEYYSLERIMHSIKSYTGIEANKILNRTGKPFWEHESFDHYSRSDEETERIVWYVLNNPVKAGMVDSWDKWRWSYYKFA